MTRPTLAAIVALALLPLAWLAPCVFGGRTFVSYDLGQFPPASFAATDEQLERARAGANFDVTEVPVWFLPELVFARDELREGRLPTWNPHARTGAPLHAHGLIGLCYPPNWLALFADDPGRRLAWVAWANLAIAGLGAFGLFRRLGFAIAPAWLGSALFELSLPMAANAFFWMRLASFVWLPAVLWAMFAVAAHDRLRPLAIGGLAAAFAMPWLGGFPPFAATTAAFAGLAYVWLCAERWRTDGRGAALRLAARLAAGLALGAGLAAPQVLPSLAFFPESARPPVPLWRDIAGQAFEPYGLLGYLMPAAFGHPSALAELPYTQAPMQLLLNTRALTDGAPALPNYNWTEYAVSVSTFGLVLAAIGLALGRGRRAWLARTALALGLGLGLFWPGLQLLFHLPIVQNAWPMRWPAATTLFVAWLAALGGERLLDAGRRLPLAAGALCIAAGAALWLLTALPLRWHGADGNWAVAALQQHYRTDRAGVIVHVATGSPPGVDRFDAAFRRFAASGVEGACWLFGAGAVLLAFAFVAGERGRLLLLLAAAGGSLAQLGVDGASVTRGAAGEIPVDTAVHRVLRERADALAAAGGITIVRTAEFPDLPSQLPPGELLRRGIRDLNFYSHADKRTLAPLRRLLERWAAALGIGRDLAERVAGRGYLTQSLPSAVLVHPWFDLCGVRYALATEPQAGIGANVAPALPGGAFFVYERPNALPRAFTVPAVTALADDDAVLAELTGDTLDPRRQAFAVAAELPAESRGESAAAAGDAAPRPVTFARDEPTHLELDVAAGAAPWLVLTDTWLPGWTATVDGAPAEVVRANHSQRLVRLPTTACRVHFRYTAPGLAAGLVLAAAAVLAWLVLCFATVRRSRAARPIG